MGYEELIQGLIREAEAKAERILSEVREEARRRIAEAMEQAERMAQQLEDGLKREADRERSVRMSRAQMEGRALFLKAQIALMEEAWTRLEDRLRLLPRQKDYSRLVEQLYREILPEFPEGEAVVRADEAALPVVRSLSKSRGVRFEPLAAGELGGLEVSDPDGTFRVQNTLRSRLAKIRPQLMIEVNRWLSGHE